MILFQALENFSWILGTIIVSIVFVAFAICGILFVRKAIGIKNLKGHHDVAGYVFTNIGVLYSVLLGFTVVNVQQRFDKIRETAQIEAGYLAELYRDSEVFPASKGQEIRSNILTYMHNIIDYEWDSMNKGQQEPRTAESLRKIWKSYYTFEPSKESEKAWYAESLSKLNSIMSIRIARLVGSYESLGTEMWSMLILGGLVMISFIWFFGVENLYSHILMASILAATTAFLLFLIYSLDTAFTGDVSIPPNALKAVLESLEKYPL